MDECVISLEKVLDIKDLIRILSDKFRTKTKELSVTRGKVHDYLGITIDSLKKDFSKKDYVAITMYDYIEDIYKEAAEGMNGTAVTSAFANLFKVNNNSMNLNTEMADYFHSVTTRLLFESKRARPNIEVEVVLLCGRVKIP